MDDFDAWIFFDGPMPESLRPVVGALRDPLPEDEEEDLRRLLERLDRKLSPPSAGDAASILRGDAGVASAPPAPPAPPAPVAPAPRKEEKPPAPLPPVVRAPAYLAETARSPEVIAEMQAGLVKLGIIPAPAVRVAGAQEHPKTLELPVMDPSQGARRPLPDLTLQQYVECRTQIEVWPEHAAYFRGRYGIESEAAYEDLARLWESRLAASPHARAHADALRASYLEQARRMAGARSGGR